jgi:hypothetical protein
LVFFPQPKSIRERRELGPQGTELGHQALDSAPLGSPLALEPRGLGQQPGDLGAVDHQNDTIVGRRGRFALNSTACCLSASRIERKTCMEWIDISVYFSLTFPVESEDIRSQELKR